MSIPGFYENPPSHRDVQLLAEECDRLRAELAATKGNHAYDVLAERLIVENLRAQVAELERVGVWCCEDCKLNGCEAARTAYFDTLQPSTKYRRPAKCKRPDGDGGAV